MRTIHKELLDWTPDGQTSVFVQPFAKLIYVGLDTRDSQRLAVWFIVNDQLPKDVQRIFHIVGTEHEIPRFTQHVGSVRMEPYIWHVFELDVGAM